MEYRSSNGGQHIGGDIVAGVNNTAGTQLSSNTITAVGDAAAVDLFIAAKGTGKVFIGGSTTGFALVSGESTMTAPAMAANSQEESTFAASGISTGDLIVCVDFRNTLSTAYLPGLPYVGASGKIHVPIANCHASTVSASTGVVVRWSYIDRT
jgi:hypothetical protein